MSGPSKSWLSDLLRAATRDLVSFITMLTGDRTLADDLFQETCLEVWRFRRRFRVGEDFGRWARGIARNVVLRHWRKQGGERATPLTAELMDTLVMEWRPFPEDSVDPREEAMAFCLAGLDASHRELLEQRYRDRWSYRRIGEATERSESAVKMLFSRLRRKLRECVEGRVLKEQRHG